MGRSLNRGSAPNGPVLAPITAHGLPRSAFPGNGREAQSSALSSAPGIDALYSGVAMSSASARAISATNARTDSTAASTPWVVHQSAQRSVTSRRTTRR
jgi:hypothetical protein